MKKPLVFTLTFLALIFSGTVSCTTVKPTESNGANQQPALQEKLIAQEKAIWDAYKQKDAKALSQLLAKDYYAIEDADGEIMSKAEALQSVSDLDLKNYEMKDLSVVGINEGSAIVRYKVKIEGAAHEHEFAPRWSAVSSVWVKRAGKWQNLMYQETKIGE